MKYEAVIFALFGTLVDIFSRAEYERVLREMATALSVPANNFSRAWIAGSNARTLGTYEAATGSSRSPVLSESEWSPHGVNQQLCHGNS